jgi:AcrR family transcriptional regulator
VREQLLEPVRHLVRCPHLHAALGAYTFTIRGIYRAGGTAVDKLKAAMHEYALIVTRDYGMCLIRVGEDPLAPAGRKELRRLKAELDHEFRALIEQGIAEGELAPRDPKLAAFTLAGALSWIGRWYDPDGPLDAESVVEQSTAILLNGLLARPRGGEGARAP